MVQKSGTSQKRKGKGCLLGCLGVVVLFGLLIVGGVIYSSKDWRSDETVLSNYQPSPEIEDIVEKNELTDKGKADFYRANPKLVDGTVFQVECLANGIESLACNTGFKIFLLDVDDPRFSDHKYAAAVHEMLHIAYRRLSSDEKASLGVLLDKELEKYSDDLNLANVVTRLQSVGRGGDVQDELHSKFGVEFANISPALEDYYKQYFVDRAKVVSLFEQGGFNKRVRRMEEIAQETEALGIRLTNMSQQDSSYNSLVAQYNAKAAESQKLYSEIQEFYKYFDSSYQQPVTK